MKLNSGNELLATSQELTNDDHQFGNESTLRLRQMEKLQNSCNL